MHQNLWVRVPKASTMGCQTGFWNFLQNSPNPFTAGARVHSHTIFEKCPFVIALHNATDRVIYATEGGTT